MRIIVVECIGRLGIYGTGRDMRKFGDFSRQKHGRAKAHTNFKTRIANLPKKLIGHGVGFRTHVFDHVRIADIFNGGRRVSLNVPDDHALSIDFLHFRDQFVGLCHDALAEFVAGLDIRWFRDGRCNRVMIGEPIPHEGRDDRSAVLPFKLHGARFAIGLEQVVNRSQRVSR